jgi:hypothetical protein
MALVVGIQHWIVSQPTSFAGVTKVPNGASQLKCALIRNEKPLIHRCTMQERNEEKLTITHTTCYVMGSRFSCGEFVEWVEEPIK